LLRKTTLAFTAKRAEEGDMICDRQPAARANRRSLDRFGLVLAAFCVRLLAFSTSTFAEDEPAASITILVYNYAEVSPRILTGAEREADRILNRAGVRAVWFDCSGKQPTIAVESVCKSGWGSRNLGVRLLFRHVPTKFQDLTFGFALFPDLASVYYGDAALLADRAEMRSELPIILGCLIVHEVGHLLLKSSNHSATGIMQAHWERKQIRQSLTGVMLFTPQQSKLIREEVRMRMSLSGDYLTSQISSR
jgi:hypothetical protein